MSNFNNPIGSRFVDLEARGAFVAEALKTGKVLIVGGQVQKMVPRKLRNHPRIVIWDDTLKSSPERREIPASTRVILFNQWTSHGLAWKLRKEAPKIGATILAMLNTKQVKEILEYALHGVTTTEKVMKEELERAQQQLEELLPQAPPAESPKKEEVVVIEHRLRWQKVNEAKIEGKTEPQFKPQPELQSALKSEPELKPLPPEKRRPSRLGEIPAFLTYYLKEGKPVDEARRLLPKLHALGIEQTEASLRGHIVKYRKLLAEGLDRTSGPGATVALAIEEAQAGRYRFDGKLPKDIGAATELSISPTVAKELLASIGKLDVDSIEQLVKNALDELKHVQPILEKLRDILPALELVFGEFPKLKAEVEKLNKLREALK